MSGLKTYRLALRLSDGTLRDTVGRYTKETHWLDSDEAHWYAAGEQRILRHVGRITGEDAVIVVLNSPDAKGDLWGLPKPLAWASGNHGFLAGMHDGCRVVIVRRFEGYVPPHLAKTHLSGITAYWTSIIETAQGSEKPMAYITSRYYTDDYTPSDELTQRNKCLRVAHALMDIEHEDP